MIKPLVEKSTEIIVVFAKISLLYTIKFRALIFSPLAYVDVLYYIKTRLSVFYILYITANDDANILSYQRTTSHLNI
jgi:hypothetical protein